MTITAPTSPTTTATSAAPAGLVPGAVVPAPRFAFGKQAPKIYKAMAALAGSIELEHGLHELVKLRASVVNGCSYCVDMHTRDLLAGGEDPRRVASVAAWHHAAFFTARERAAFALTDAVTHLGEHGVTDAVWADAETHFPDAELAQLLGAIIMINAWNRLAVPLETIPDDVAAHVGRT